MMIRLDLKNKIKKHGWFINIFAIGLFCYFCFTPFNKALAGELVFSNSYVLTPNRDQTFSFDLPVDSVLFWHVLTQYTYFDLIQLDGQDIGVSFEQLFRNIVDYKDVYGYKSIHTLSAGTHSIRVSCISLPCYLDVFAFSGVSTTTTSIVTQAGDLSPLPVSNVLNLSIASSTLGFNNSGVIIGMVGTMETGRTFSSFTPTTGTIISDLSEPIPIGSFYFPTTGAGSWDVGFDGVYSPAGSVYAYDTAFWVADIEAEATPTTTGRTAEDFFKVGDYIVPRSINCYRDVENCDMVFGFNASVYSRSIASTSPTLWSYPAFTWLWPNALGQDIASGTIRKFIDYGVVDGLALSFQFPRPTSTTAYTLEIYDPYNSIGTTSDFVVNVNLVGSSTSPDIFSSCLGACSSGILGDIFCGIKLALCWGLSPSKSSYLYLSQSSTKLTDKFPFSLSFDLLDALKTGLLTTDDRTGVFRIPMRQATTTGSELIWIEVANASTTEKAIGKDNYILIRKTIVWLAWIGVAIFIVKLLFFKKKA